MIAIHKKTLQDLEFSTVCEQLAERCHTALGKNKALETVPYASEDAVVFGLHQTQEYVSSELHETVIPNHNYDTVDREIKFLGVEDSVLDKGSFKKLSSLSETVNTHLRFFKKYQERYPVLYKTVATNW